MTQLNLHEANDLTARQEAERQYLQRLAQGDRTAFWELWRQYQDDILFRCSLRWMRGDYEDAEDALSAASIKAYKGLQTSPDEIANVKGWLLRLLRNHCIDVGRERERRLRVMQLVEDIDRGFETATTKQQSVEDVVSRCEIAHHIIQAIDDLPGRLREPARLRFLSEMPHRDIALQLNLSPENVRKRLQQARALLRPLLVRYK